MISQTFFRMNLQLIIKILEVAYIINTLEIHFNIGVTERYDCFFRFTIYKF